MLAGILIYVMRPLREGYPYTASYTMLSTDGGLNDSVEDRLKDSPPVCIVYTREEDKKRSIWIHCMIWGYLLRLCCIFLLPLHRIGSIGAFLNSNVSWGYPRHRNTTFLMYTTL